MSETAWPLRARSLMSEREKTLYQDLIALYPDHKIFVQVALSQLIDVAQEHPDRMSIRGRFKQLVADFVLCRSDLTIVTVIELDDRTHFRADRKRADARKTKALADAGLRLVRIPPGPIPPLGKLKSLIEEAGAPQFSGTGKANEFRIGETVRTSGTSGANHIAGSFGAQMLQQTTLKVLALGVIALFVVVGWLGDSNSPPNRGIGGVDPAALKFVTPQVATAPTPVEIPHNATSPSVTPTEVAKSAALQPTDPAALLALQKQKILAWLAFYSAPSSCDSPPTWKDQVECGNQYIRARGRFEQQWSAAHPTDHTQAPLVLDNASIKQSSRSGH